MRIKHLLHLKRRTSIRAPYFLRKTFGMRKPISLIYILLCSFIMLSSIYFSKYLISHFDDLLVILYEKIDVPIQKVRDIYYSKEDYFNTIERIKSLELENQDLRMKDIENQILVRENNSLKNINNYMNALNSQYVTTKVVSSSIDDSGINMMINIGSKQGLHEGQPVVSADGLIGRVVRVNERSARILLINNSGSKIPVRFLESGIRCIAVGTSNSDLLTVKYLEQSSNPINGEIVVTSGEGGLIPPDIPVGRLRFNNISEGAFIEPNVNFNTVYMVSVIIS